MQLLILLRQIARVRKGRLIFHVPYWNIFPMCGNGKIGESLALFYGKDVIFPRMKNPTFHNEKRTWVKKLARVNKTKRLSS